MYTCAYMLNHFIRMSTRSGQTIFFIKLVFAASLLKRQHLGERAKTGWLKIRIMYQGVRHVNLLTIVSVSLHYKNPTKRVRLAQNGHHHHHVIEI